MNANERYVQQMQDYLRTATDEDWMFVACDLNYDEGLPLIEWMVSAARCPQAAALAIYWLMSPTYLKTSNSNSLERDRQILATIEGNYPACYKESEFGFDPRNDVFADPEGHDWTQRDDSLDLIPAKLRSALNGEKLSSRNPRFADWVDCRPPELLVETPR